MSREQPGLFVVVAYYPEGFKGSLEFDRAVQVACPLSSRLPLPCGTGVSKSGFLSYERAGEFL